jgi:ribosomal protein RSM22 (predicted rRNA methylase)
MKLNTHDWNRLRELREGFLKKNTKNYWHSQRDLELYDQTYAARIGWKWNAVLEDLSEVGWLPQTEQIVDWGCGTGIAARTVAPWSGISQVAFFDQSPHAIAFAQKKLQEELQCTISTFSEKHKVPTLLLISHVISELSEKELLELAYNATTAEEVIWVESGSHELSRKLGSMRKIFLEVGYHLIAPCTHESACPMFQEKQARDWCHFFAQPPTGIFQSSFWHEASRELGIDLRSLPYCYLAFSKKRPTSSQSNAERLIGKPRALKGYGKLLCCSPAGLCERLLQKRDNPNLFKKLIKNHDRGVYRWSLNHSGHILDAQQ